MQRKESTGGIVRQGRQAAGAIACLDEVGAIRGEVLLLGDERTLATAAYLADRGHALWVVCERGGTEEARWRDLRGRGDATLSTLLCDPENLGELNALFDTIVDLNVLDRVPRERQARYARSLRARLRPGGLLHVICERRSAAMGTDPSVEILRTVFEPGWWLIRVDAARRDDLPGSPPAWIATFMATESPWQALGDPGRRPGRPDSRLVATG